MRILIAEDEPRISRFVARGLKAHGYTPTVVEDGITALDYASSGEFDLLVLDVGLPRMDGFAVLRALRDMGAEIPVLMCTARDSVEDTVHGLEGGADDYLAKPFRFEELLARIKLRARERTGGTTQPTQEIRELGDLSLNLRTRVATVGTGAQKREVELSSREYALLALFLEHPNQVLTQEIILSRVWGYDYDGASNVVVVYLRYLRKKMGADRFITVRGAGYKLVDPRES
ncbi:DNA-binding response regulator [Kocuria sp. WRN011]|uniref:response regulator transcription factor n=1 Tax=Kocuria TaxID=57493 RepID=UPI000BB077A2|nr:MULTISPECIES: response regulator transcription factor [Kocuria]MCT1802939.1 response regulator transcription factor [Kocuria carniphila]PBB07911.1 DNA-binding response regulator [Kocuria sp. WRN011]PZP30560.1 MAG: DNA-binding response regulator [Kocuria rhizophila]